MMKLTPLFGRHVTAAIVALMLSAAMVGSVVAPALHAQVPAQTSQGVIA